MRHPRRKDLACILLLGRGRQMKQVGHVKSNQEGELQVCRSFQLAGQSLPRLGKAGRTAFFRGIHSSGGTIKHITQCSTSDWQAAVLGRNSSSLSIISSKFTSRNVQTTFNIYRPLYAGQTFAVTALTSTAAEASLACNASPAWKRSAISLKSLCQRAASIEERRLDSLHWTAFWLAKRLSTSGSLASHFTEPVKCHK